MDLSYFEKRCREIAEEANSVRKQLVADATGSGFPPEVEDAKRIFSISNFLSFIESSYLDKLLESEGE